MKFRLLLCLLLFFCYNEGSSLSAGLQNAFKAAPLSADLLNAMKTGHTFTATSPVPPHRLRLLTLPYMDFDGQAQVGHMVVLDACVPAVLRIFETLYHQKFPIDKMRLLHHYHGDDDASMADNNTSCHCDRGIAKGRKKSLHAYGTAIDVNPVQNPYICFDKKTGTATFFPPASVKYANRKQGCWGKFATKGMVEPSGLVELFAANGFYRWGGNWRSCIDYQHFEISRALTELYLVMSPQEALTTFQKATAYYNTHQKPLEEVLHKALKVATNTCLSLAAHYQKNHALFMAILKDL